VSRRAHPRRLARLAAAVVVLGTGACGSPEADEPDGGALTVYAAASLTDVFERLGGQFREEHPDIDLTIGYGSSSGSARAIVEGAPVDVFASADELQMQVVTGAGLAPDPVVFTSNVLTIAVPTGNPAGVTGLADFARDDLALAVCAPEVPCGAAAERLFEVAGVAAVPDTYEEDVRSALTKVELGEVDAAVVYATDVRARGQVVEGIDVPEAEQVVNRYPIAVLSEARNPEAAQAFVDLVLSEDGRRVLADHGFRAP
jgi:molybdate transport system substrate-binding protein